MGWDDKYYYALGKVRVYAAKGKAVTLQKGSYSTPSMTVPDSEYVDCTVPGINIYDVYLDGVQKATVPVSFGEIKKVDLR